MKLQPSTIDISLSTLDQQAPTVDKPLGRLTAMVNAVVKQYQNPRAADGTVTHIKVEKRDGFSALPNALVDGNGNSLGTLSVTPQVFFGGGDALRMVAGNQLFTKSQAWVQAQDPTGEASIVFPQIVRSTSIYAANSQSEAADIAISGSVACIAWREVAEQSAGNGTSAPSATISALDGVRVCFRDATTGATIRTAFTLDPVGGGTTTYLKVRVYAYAGKFWVLQDFIGETQIFICATVFDANGVQLATTTLSPVVNGLHWDAITINGEGVVVAIPNNGSGLVFHGLTYTSSIVVSSHTDTSISCGSAQPVAWLVDPEQTANTGYLVAMSVSGSTATLTPYRIVSLAANHTYPVLPASFDATKQWVSGITGYKDVDTTKLVCAYTLMDFKGFLEYTAYQGTHVAQSDSFQNTEATNGYPDQLNNTIITCLVPFTGSASVIQTRYALSLVSRPFQIDGDWVAWAYYPARKWGPLSANGKVTTPATHAPNRPADPSNFQPCWYLIPLTSKQRIAGRLEYGLASADYQVLQPGNPSDPSSTASAIPGYRNRCLCNVAITPNGAPMTALGYRAEQNIPANALVSQDTTTFTGVNTSQTVFVYSSSDTIGVKTFTIGPDSGQAFQVNGTTYLPGTMAATIEAGEVTVSEHGIIAPECPWIVFDAIDHITVSPKQPYGEWFYRCVSEYVTSRGKTYRSLPSAPFAFTNLTADTDYHFQYVCGHYLNPTNKPFVRYSIYRTSSALATVTGSAQQTTPPTIQPTTTITGMTSVFYKITNDLQPFYNQPDTKVFTSGNAPDPTNPGTPTAYRDSVDPSTQVDGEQLYTDNGFLPRYPCPALRGGCIWQNRAWVIGYDNALWFSGEVNEQDGEWFNPGFRVTIPNNEEITAIASLDAFLLVFCSNSIWYIELGAALPDSTGSGTTPSAIRLPFEMGCTGFTSVVRQGCLYSSSNGGVWLLTRSLDNQWIGQAAKDDLSNEITGMVVAGNYVCVSTKTGAPWSTIVYDTNLGGWSNWAFQADGFTDTILIAAKDGLLAWSDTGRVFMQAPGTYQDIDSNSGGSTLYVSMGLTISPVHIGGVRSYKRTWAIQLQGTVYDDCDLSYTLTYSDNASNTASYGSDNLAVGLLEQEIRPTKQLSTSIGVTVSDTQGDTIDTGKGFSLESVSFYIGLEKGLSKIAPGKRAKAT